MLNWIKDIFAHPKTTLGGLGALLGAAAIGYGMSTGAIPIDGQSVAMAGGLASAGLAGISGKDANPVKLIDTATEASPIVDVVQHYQRLQMEANTAQDKLNQFTAVNQALAQALPPELQIRAQGKP